MLAALRRSPHFEFAEPDFIYPPALTPNDPYYSSEWHLPKIQASQAWDITTGSSSVVIAILDSGVEVSHPDLAGLLVPGWNFYSNNADTSDVTGHGTPVAGAAAAEGNNSQGVTGVSWGCRIMPIRISDTNGYASLSTIASGLTWAADQGARVANISYRASSGSTITSAAQYFQSKGGVVAVSSGNNGTFDSSTNNPYILTVGATDENDTVATFSNTGNNLDLVAPGVNIMTTASGGTYGSGTGTSFSAPVVAGVAALVVSANPALTGAQIQEIVVSSADDLGVPGWDATSGWGRLNASRAVQAATSAVSADIVPPSAAILSPPSGSRVSNSVLVQVSATDNVAVARVDLLVDGKLFSTSPSPTPTFSWITSKLAPGIHTLQAVALDLAGNRARSSVIKVTK